MSQTKLCPYCSEPIQAAAIKCKHCGSMLGGTDPGVFGAGPAAPDMTGQTILGYRIERELGEGGMGTVYLAVHPAVDQWVAIKVLDPHLAKDPETRERFIQEARIQIKLEHQGIVRVLTANTDAEPLALVMEHIDGFSLAQVIERRGALPVDEALHLFGQILGAVGYAHAQADPVIHRDLKPSNVMVQADGTTKVMDFGIAKVVGGAKLTRTGTVMGSAHYMSPEQILTPQALDYRSDIYSLGVTFYEALTGRAPFEGLGDDNTDSDFLVKKAHTEQEPPDPRTFRPDLPESLVAALMRSLAKSPDHRYGSCAEFQQALSQAAAQPQAATTRPTVVEQPQAHAATPQPAQPLPKTVIEPPRPRPTPAPDPSTDYDDSSTHTPTTNLAPVIAVVGGLALLVVILVVILAVAVGSNKRSREVVTVSPSPTTTSSRPSEPTTPTRTVEPSTPAATSSTSYQGRFLSRYGYDMVHIESGTFQMGSLAGEGDSDEDQHRVHISDPFLIGETEVTQKLWTALMDTNQSNTQGDNLPVETITWYEAVQFCNSLSAREGLTQAYRISGNHVTWNTSADGYRLPTEAEWEYAARAGETQTYSGSWTIDSVGWYRDNSGGRLHAVALKTANDWGLHDMTGNVWEWVWDGYGPYSTGTVTDPTGPASGFTARVRRGGGYTTPGSKCRVANRLDYQADFRDKNLGMRLARSLD